MFYEQYRKAMMRLVPDRRSLVSAVAVVALLVSVVLAFSSVAQEGRPAAHLLEITGPIGPATLDYLERGLDRAAEMNAPAVVLRIDTPGGLDTSTRKIVQVILSSSVPVIGYVSPRGARAASAGTYIMYACHFAAMASATSLGAATPVQIGAPGFPRPSPGGLPKRDPTDGGDQSPSEQQGTEAGTEQSTAGDEPRAQPDGAGTNGNTGEGSSEKSPETPYDGGQTAMERKVVNDAVAFIRGLALMRGRNAEWAEEAVRRGSSLTATDALARNVIDLVVPDVATLLEQVHGRQVEVAGAQITLDTRGLDVTTFAPDWRSELLAIITNPNVAYLLMLLGVYGLFFELSNPGNILPGVAGVIAITLALYAFHVLPVNYAGLALIAIGMAFMVGEVFVPSFGALGIGGVIAFIAGSLILVDSGSEAFAISVPLIVTVGVVTVLFVAAVMSMVLRQRRRPIVTGREQLMGSSGEVLADFDANGTIRLGGELWHARTRTALHAGQAVRVVDVDGLTLDVKPLSEEF